MTEAVTTRTFADLMLPPNVITKTDVSRIVVEMEQLDNAATEAVVRAKAGVASPAIAPLSQQLTDFLVQNQLKIDDARARGELIKQMRLLKEKAPVLHMTFAVTADPESLQQLTHWVRTSIHPQAVISVGKQPALVAGVYLRTSNRVQDLSLRAKLEANRGLLLKEVEALRG